MPSSSQPSPEPAGPRTGSGGEEHFDPTEMEVMRRRFIEALRRAEIISLLTTAGNEEDLGKALTEELCEVYDAEIALIAEIGGDGERVRLIAAVGVVGPDLDRLSGAAELSEAIRSSRAVAERGSNLLGLGARSVLLASHRAEGDRRVVLGAARLYPSEFDHAESALLETIAVSAAQALERLWSRRHREELISKLKESFVGTAKALANALEAKDDYTADHASEVADMAVALGREMGLDEGALEDLHYGAIFHDIGKIAIPDAILHKRGPLDPTEREVMMTHPDIGAEIVAPIPFFSDAVREMVRHDHEHWDGSGYPDGLRGEGIPLGARIILVVDGFHAMTSDRPYRKAMPRREAMAELARHSGTQFDPNVVSAFLRIVGDG